MAVSEKGIDIRLSISQIILTTIIGIASVAGTGITVGSTMSRLVVRSELKTAIMELTAAYTKEYKRLETNIEKIDVRILDLQAKTAILTERMARVETLGENRGSNNSNGSTQLHKGE